MSSGGRRAGFRSLIVNADDLGRSPGINRGIFEAHERGIVSSATLMVAYPWSPEAASALARYPSLGVGLHVALTGGPSVLSAERVPSLLDAEARLPRRPEDLDGADPREIEAEVEAQLEAFRRLTGRLPSHLDSHHHSHRRPEVSKAVVSLAKRWSLPVRNASPEVLEDIREAGLATTDTFDERFYGPGARLEGLLEILRSLPAGTTELMCHPARRDTVLATGSTYVEERVEELAALTHPRARAVLQEEGIQLIHFGQLPAASP